MFNNILLVASLFTALGCIVATVVKVYKFIRKCEEWIEEKDKHDNENYKAILRLVIMTPEMPLSERISAGDTYVNELHRNGAVKQNYNELLQRFKTEHLEG